MGRKIPGKRWWCSILLVTIFVTPFHRIRKIVSAVNSTVDEKLLLEAERIHCPASKLTKEERARNVFGAVLSHHFDPYAVNTYFSNDDELKLPDIPQCQTVVTESVPNLVPVTFFKPVLLDGTTFPIAGFPSLTILPGTVSIITLGK